MIKTSYFKKAKDLPNTVSIAKNDFPWTIKGYKFNKYKALVPSLALLRDWRAGKLTQDEYGQRYYRETLSKLSPTKVYKELDGKILLCHEPSGDFCHRRLAAKWLEHSLGVHVPEL